jgi:hypothetical protein
VVIAVGLLQLAVGEEEEVFQLVGVVEFQLTTVEFQLPERYVGVAPAREAQAARITAEDFILTD